MISLILIYDFKNIYKLIFYRVNLIFLLFNKIISINLFNFLNKYLIN